MRFRSLQTVALLGCAVLALAPASSALATQSSDAIGAVNTIRAQVGVAPIVDDPLLASDCAAHATWMSTHRTISHEPTVDATPTIMDAAKHSVLAVRIPGAAQTSVESIHWLRGAPLHLQQILHPALTRSGYAWVDGWSCMAVRDFTLRPLLSITDRSRGMNEITTWPPAGAVGVATSEDTHEEAPSPNELIGLPHTQVTGPYLLVFAAGFGANPSCAGTRIVSATLTEPDGAAVPVRSSDDQAQRERAGTPATACRTGSGTGFLAPLQPLAPGTTYTATVAVVGVGAREGTPPTTKSWSFTTGEATPIPNLDRVQPALRVARSVVVRRGARKGTFQLRVTVKDASATTCAAVVARKAAPCAVKRGVIVLTGVRSPRLRALAWTLLVRDSAGNATRLVGAMR
ncbi:MAG: hypothetical protein JWM86_2956 [Thermoleophilia bacterium]|nr:hypothetical protein [Thermoleophilia bacterium]